MRLAVLFSLFLLPACLGSAAPADAGVDLNFDVDGFGDLAGAYNCSQLNACEEQCKNTMCVAACRQMATPQAVAKEVALQDCFNQWCPQKVDMGMPICAPDPNSGAFSPACQQCVANTQAPSTTSCNPVGAPECTKCFNEMQACKND